MSDAGSSQERSAGQLVSDLSQQVSSLVRAELKLAQLELTRKGKLFGLGVGLFGVAGLLGFLGLGALVATAILALALAVDAWLAALIVTVVLFAAAAVAALTGKKEVAEATPLAPQQATEGVQRDIAVVKEATQR